VPITTSPVSPPPPAADANLAHPIPHGALCRLVGSAAGRIARVYPDVRLGQPWTGTYRVQAEDGMRWISGLERDELVVLTRDEAIEHFRSSARTGAAS
jgi:hypothetical protein